MTDPRRPGDQAAPGRSPGDLDAALRELRPAVAFPPTPDLAAAVSRVIAVRRPVFSSDAEGRPGDRRPGWAAARDGRSWPGRFAVAGLALLLLLGAALSLSGDLRSAVADRLGIPGIRLELVDETPTPEATPSSGTPTPGTPSPGATPPPVGATLLLGEQVSLAEAQAVLPYAVKVPAPLGAPDEVYVRPVSEGAMVTLLYRARPGLPSAAETGVGALVMQFPAGVDSADIAKKVLFGSGSLVEVTVGDEDGYWVTGASELVLLEDPAAGIVDDPGRPSANVLLWASGGVTYRLETALSLPDALALAESLAAGDGTLTPMPSPSP